MTIERYDGLDEAAYRVGQRQSLFREVNDRIEELTDASELAGTIQILCECGSDGCEERIELTRAEYERLRLVPIHFAVRPGHDIPAVERVFQEEEAYIVVEKTGEAAAAANRLEPRSRRSA